VGLADHVEQKVHLVPVVYVVHHAERWEALRSFTGGLACGRGLGFFPPG
jgi:hypothetical protein